MEKLKKLQEKKALELAEIEGIGIEDDEDVETHGKGEEIDGKQEAGGFKRERKTKKIEA